MHALFYHLDSGVDLVPSFDGVALLQVNPDGTVHLLHSFFSVPAGLYSVSWGIFAFRGELSSEGLPPVVELPVYTFGVRRSVRAVPREYNVSHLEGVTPSVWQSTPCKRSGKAAD